MSGSDGLVKGLFPGLPGAIYLGRRPDRDDLLLLVHFQTGLAGLGRGPGTGMVRFKGAEQAAICHYL